MEKLRPVYRGAITRSFSEADCEAGGQGLSVGLDFPDAPNPQPPNHVPLEPGAPESARLIPGLSQSDAFFLHETLLTLSPELSKAYP